MSEDIEQITKAPIESNVKTKEKDPKKVAAGKRLAEYNKRAKEALKEKKRREAEKATEPEERETGESAISVGWIPEVSFTTAISLVGIGLTAINLFMSYKKGEITPQVRLPEPCEPSPPAVARSQPSTIPVPKMGML